MRRVRLLIIAIVALSPAVAGADDHGAASDTAGLAGMDAMLTRYGTAHETLYQFNVKPEATVYRGPFAASVILPLTAGYTVHNSCCRFTLGNITLATAYVRGNRRGKWWINSSVSFPTSELTDKSGYVSAVAATAAITSDAGYYLPNTTAVRVGAGRELAVSRRLAVGAEVGAHYWAHSMGVENQWVIPVTLFGRAQLGKGFSSRVALRNIANLNTMQERWLHQMSASVAYEWNTSRVGATLALPLDESLRALGMVSTGVSFARKF